ncbi:MAG: hypothetical protein WCF57_01540 [Pyrinomonadaceae bacterium]
MTIPRPRIILLAVAFILACSISGFAQKRFCEIPPPSPFKHNALIVTRYDKPTKRMKTVLEHPVSLGHAAGETLYLSASFFFSDPKLRMRPMLDIHLISVSKEPKLRNSRDLSLLADYARLPLVGPTQYQSGKTEKGLVQEVLTATITYDTLFNLIRSKRVTAQLGSAQLELTNNHLESLREVASLMVPQERNMILASRLGQRPRQATNH